MDHPSTHRMRYTRFLSPRDFNKVVQIENARLAHQPIDLDFPAGGLKLADASATLSLSVVNS